MRSSSSVDGAERWLIKAAAAGAQRVRRKMAEAVDLAKLHGTEEVDRALRACAEAGRFGDGDLASILAHQQQAGGELILFPARSEEHSLQRSTQQLGGIRAMSEHDYYQIARSARPECSTSIPTAVACRRSS